jgi:cytosine/adenosine deaminase-related metal-dependent hydrolase
VHLDRQQVRRCAEKGYWLVQNPRSNEGNRVGYALNLGASDRVALGCDGWDADMKIEQQALERLAALHGDHKAQARLANGHALVAERFASDPQPLQPGALADLVVRQDGVVRHVVVGGQVVVADGALVAGDLESIGAQAQQQAARLWQRMAAIA